MITPLEIEQKEFSKSVRGYDRDEVDEFLDLIILDLQDLMQELGEIKAENAILREENEEHLKSQKRVMDTLDSAKKLMKDISDSAEKRAEIIINNAKIDAEMILNEARNAVPSAPVGEDGNELRDRIAIFRSKYRQLLLDELNSLDSRSDGLLADLEKEFIPASMDTQVLDVNSLSDLEFEDKDMQKAKEAGETDLAETEDIIAQLETEADELAKNSNIPKAKDTVVFNAKELEELLAKDAQETKE